jgi:hypothetical protein
MDKRVPFCTEEEFERIRQGDFAQFQKALETVHAVAVQHALLAFPETIIKLLQNVAAMQADKTAFMEKHKDVLVKPELFSKALAEVEEEEPGLGYGVLLDKAAERTKTYVNAFRAHSDPQQTRPEQSEVDGRLKEAFNDSDGPFGDSGDSGLSNG